MIPALALLVWAYAVARLLQTPFENAGISDNMRSYLALVSLLGALAATYALYLIWAAPTPAAP